MHVLSPCAQKALDAALSQPKASGYHGTTDPSTPDAAAQAQAVRILRKHTTPAPTDSSSHGAGAGGSSATSSRKHSSFLVDSRGGVVGSPSVDASFVDGDGDDLQLLHQLQGLLKGGAPSAESPVGAAPDLAAEVSRLRQGLDAMMVRCAATRLVLLAFGTR